MTWSLGAFFPFVIQALVMGVDEFFCHRRRTLRRWERVGHPLDTAFFLLCLVWLLLNSPSPFALTAYSCLVVGSSLFISKDEWEHSELCSGFENWLHALLFILHPTVLILAGWMWWQQRLGFAVVIGSVAALGVIFALYQALYWNVWRRD